MNVFKISKCRRSQTSSASASTIIDEEAPCLIVGEVAQAHDGSLGMAHPFIDSVARAGGTRSNSKGHTAAENTPVELWGSKSALMSEFWRASRERLT